MVKKKFSGQTLAIIILAILLIGAIGFGGVYAFYTARSSKVMGKVYMATLNIKIDTGSSEESEIAITNYLNVVPGQALENTPLTVKNWSKLDIYIIVVYKINASIETKDKEGNVIKTETINDEYKKPVLGLGYEYINSIHTEESTTKGIKYNNWVDYVFDAPEQDTQYRVLVSMEKCGKGKENEKGEVVESTDAIVIGNNQLSLSGAMGNDFQGAHISFTFQAFAIPASSFNNPNDQDGNYIDEDTTNAQKAEIITRAIYTSQDKNKPFLGE